MLVKKPLFNPAGVWASVVGGLVFGAFAAVIVALWYRSGTCVCRPDGRRVGGPRRRWYPQACKRVRRALGEPRP